MHRPFVPFISCTLVCLGVELGYGVLSDETLKELKIGEVVDNGFVFLWGINSKWELCFDLVKAWGFEYFTMMHWIKKSRKSGKIAKGHGFYLMHSKEFILVGKRGMRSISPLPYPPHPERPSSSSARPSCLLFLFSRSPC